MAERTVSVKLNARVEQYLAAMKAAATATGLTTQQLTNMQRVGGQMQRIGGSLSRYVSLPLAAIGAVAVHSAMQWETSFAQMQGLASVTADEVDGLQESVLALAGETARSPQDLAAGLYLAASAGLDSAEAMEVVEMAAHAAAAGMGDTATVVDLLTSVLGSYGSENITAARAADILTAAVRQGKAEPAEMAQALGRVLPIAASMGITFEETAASVAFLTNAGLDTDEAVTALRGTMLALLDPTAQANKALEESGTSAAELKAAIDQGGLLGALELLRTHGFDTNAQALSNLVEDNRALVGATALLADESNSLVPIMNAVADSSGSLGEAFGVVADTDAFKMRQAISELQVAMIEIGSIILPIAATIGSAIADLAGWFADLPGPVKTLVVIFGGLAAAAGPVVVIAGSLIKNWQTLSSVMGAASGVMRSAGLALGAIGVVAVAAYLGVQYLGQRNRELKARSDEVTAALLEQANQTFRVALESYGAETAVAGLAAANEALNNSILTGEGGEKIVDAMGALGLQSENALKWLVLLSEASDRSQSSVIALGAAAGVTGTELMVLGEAVTTAGSGNLEQLRSGLVLAAVGMGYTQDAAEELADRLLPTAEAMRTLNREATTLEDSGALANAATEFLNMAAAASESADGLIRLAEEQTGFARGSENSVEVYRRFAELLAASEQPTQDAILGVGDLAVANDAMAIAVEGSTEAVEEQEGVLGSTIDTVSDLTQRFTDAADAAGMFRDAINTVTSPAKDLADAQEELWANALGFTDAIDENSRSLDMSSEAGLANRDVIEDWADSIWDSTAAQLANGDSIEVVSGAWYSNRQALLDAADAADFTEDEVNELLDTYGLTPEDLITTIGVYNDEIAKAKVDAVLARYDDIPPDKATDIQAFIDERAYGKAMGALLELEVSRSAKVTVTANTQPAYDAILALRGINIPVYVTAHNTPRYSSASGRYVPAGSNITTTAGEGGDEVILPLTNPARMAQLLGMAAVGPRVLAAMGGGSARGDLPPITIYNNGRDLTAGDVARAIEMSRTS